MARFVAGNGSNIGVTNYPFLDFGDLTPTSQQASQFVGDYRVFGQQNDVVTLSGSGFTYNGVGLPVGGTITGITESLGTQKLYELTGISMSAQQFIQWTSAGPGGGPNFEGDASLFSGNDYIEGSNAKDVLFAYGGNDVIRSWGGNDLIDGGSGIDLLQITASYNDYAGKIQKQASGYYTITGPEGTDQLYNMELIQFNDSVMVGLDAGGTGGLAYRLYQAAFDRTPDEKGLGYWIAQLDKGMDLVEVSARFIDSNEFRSLYGTNPSTQDFVTKIYNNVLNRAPDQGGLNFYVNQIDSGQKSAAKVLADFSDSPENQNNVNPTIANGFKYDLWLG